jgi:hypothetical protein
MLFTPRFLLSHTHSLSDEIKHLFLHSKNQILLSIVQGGGNIDERFLPKIPALLAHPVIHGVQLRPELLRALFYYRFG